MTAKGAWPAEDNIEAAFNAELTKAQRDVDTMVKTNQLNVKYATAEIHHLAWYALGEAGPQLHPRGIVNAALDSELQDTHVPSVDEMRARLSSAGRPRERRHRAGKRPSRLEKAC
jgi:hypothetical protein